jgi:two-component system alkaline phosphatase synthesis response regulator PhoP
MTRLLIVDDDQDTTRLLEMILSRDGYETKAVNNGSVAVSEAITYQPDVILLDLMMPIVDGLEVCRNLRADARFKRTAIILFTAKGDLDTQMTAFEAGANAFLQKPVRPQELRQKINELLNSSTKD